MAAVSRPALTAATPSLHRVRWSSIRDSFRGRAGEPSIGRNPAKGWLDTPKTLADSSSRRGGHHRWTGPTNRIAAPVRLQPIGRAAGRFATERRDGAERALPLWPGCGRLRRRLRDACSGRNAAAGRLPALPLCANASVCASPRLMPAQDDTQSSASAPSWRPRSVRNGHVRRANVRKLLREITRPSKLAIRPRIQAESRGR
jgi:hypothetical protein